MVKKELPGNEKPAQVNNKGKKRSRQLIFLIAAVAAAVLAYKLWENPKLLDELRSMWPERKTEEDVCLQQVGQLQQQIADLREQLAEAVHLAANPDFSEINRRIDDMEQINVNTIKSKANVETVLGLIGRMDNAEGRLNDLAKVTDDGALILTAAMLVKDAAERGGPFIYEAEVLSELAAGHHRIAGEIARINEIAPQGVLSVKELQEKFAEILAARYPAATGEEAAAAGTWKERIYNELHKVVRIKKAGDAGEKTEVSEQDRAWEIIQNYVAAGQISKAVAVAEKPLNAEVAEDAVMKGWLNQARAYRDFYDSVSRISANALAVMKVKFLCGEK